jgi:DNA-binding protein H-NS
LLFFYDYEFNSLLSQAAAFAEHIASAPLTLEFAAERRQLEGRIECLRTQHTEAVQDKSAAKKKSCNLMEKLSAVEAKKEDLGRRRKRRMQSGLARRPRLPVPRSTSPVPRPTSLSNMLLMQN